MKAGDRFTRELFKRLLAEEYEKLQRASNRDVHDDSKHTTLPIAREIVETYVMDDVKLPWYIDLLNINLENHRPERRPSGASACSRRRFARTGRASPRTWISPASLRKRLQSPFCTRSLGQCGVKRGRALRSPELCGHSQSASRWPRGCPQSARRGSIGNRCTVRRVALHGLGARQRGRNGSAGMRS